MYGTEKIKEAIDFGLGLGFAVKDALEDDGQIKGLGEYISIAKAAKPIIDVIKNMGEIKKEYLDLDETEKIELQQYFSAKFDIPNDKVEVMIERAFKLVLDISDFIIDEIA